MKKGNKMMKVSVFALLLAVVSVSLVSGTYAKYTSEFSGSDSAIVAKWDVRVSAEGTAVKVFDESKVFDLTAEGNVGTEDDIEVRNRQDTAIIAPGTGGSFAIVLTNDSDVAAEYQFNFTANEAGVPLKWSLDNQNWVETAEALDANATGTIAVDGDDKTVTVYWKWDFERKGEGVDAEDTALGTADTLATPTVNVAVTFTQVD